MLSSPRRPDTTIRIFSSAVYCLRVLRRISRTVLSAGSFLLIDFCLIFVPFGHYDEPEILRYAITSIYPKGADVRHSQPKEAALDYMADGVWQDRRENVRKDKARFVGETQGEPSAARAAANDNALARIARDVRRTAFGWRHAQTVSSFADGRRQVLAAYDDLRERTRIEGDTVALGGAFQETLTRHAILLKQAETFRARPDDFASLLAERGGIARKDLDAFEDLHARARRHRRAATMRHVHRIKREAEQEAQHPKPELRQGELALEGGRAEAPRRADTVTRDTAGMQSPDRDAAPARHLDTLPPVEAEDYPWAHAAAAQEDVLPPDLDPPRPDWYAPYEALQRDWNELIERVRQTGEPLFYARGYADMILRIQALAENPDIAAETRAPMIEILEKHQRYLSARQYVEDYLDAAERHMDTHASLRRAADILGVPIIEVSDYPGWRQEAGRLTEAAETILADGETYGVHLDNMETGRVRVERELSRLSHVIRDDGEYAPKVKTPEPRSDPADIREKVEQQEPAKPAWMPSYEALRQDWNSLIEDARQAGMPSFYAKGYIDIIPRIRELTENPDIPAKSRAPLIRVLENHQRYLSTRKHILDYPGEVERHMDARASLQDVAGDQEIEVTGVPAYPDWRQEAERLTAAGKAILSGKKTYGTHLDRIVDAKMHMIRALSELREAIRGDDKELAERKARELRRLQNRHWVGPRFALDEAAAPDPARAMFSGTAPVRAALSPLRPHHWPSRRRAGLPRSTADRDLRAGGSGALGGTEAGLEPPGGSRRGRGRPCHLHGWLRPSTREVERRLQEHAPGSRRQIGDKHGARSDWQGRVKPQLLRQLSRTHGGPNGPPRGAGGQGGRAGRGGSRPGGLRHMAERDRLCGGSLRRTHGRPWEDTPSTSITSCSAEVSLGSALSRGFAKCLKTTTGTSRRSLAGQREGESIQVARGIRRPPHQRSGEAPGVAATARRTQGRKAAAEQGPPLEHANVVRQCMEFLGQPV